MDGSLPGSPVPGILQARTLEWVAISFSNAWKWKVKVKSLSRVRPSATPRTAAYQAPPSMGFSRQEYWSGVPLPSPPSCLPIILSIYQLLWAVFSWRSGLTLSRARISRSGHPKSDLGMRILVLTLERTLNTFQVALVVKNSLATAGDMRWGFDPWVGKIPWRKAWQPAPVFLPGKPHGLRSPVGYSPWGLRVRPDWNDLARTHLPGIFCTHIPGIFCSYPHNRVVHVGESQRAKPDGHQENCTTSWDAQLPHLQSLVNCALSGI